MKKIYLILFLALPMFFSAQSVQGTWKLAQQAGALAVGPNQGDGSWWSNSANDLTVRDCFFDDSITFDANGNMMHYMDGSTWVEAWQGVASEQCGTPVAPHDGSGTYTYTFANNQLTVNGLGAHIGLPKAINGGEINDPANAVSSITYEISFGANGELIADIQSAGGGTGWWRFIYQPTNAAPPPPPTTHDVTFVVSTDTLVASGATVSADGIFIGGGFVGGHDALALSDPDGDGIWEGSMNLPAAGGHFTILNGNCSDWSCKEDIAGQSCADPSNWNDRNNLLGGFSQDTTLYLQYGSCSGGPASSYDVTFVVHTDSLVASGGTVSSDGIYIGGGFVGGHDALPLTDADGDGVWEGSMNLPAAGGHFTILNGNCGDWSCKEDIAGQPCADPSNWNDRNNLLGGFTQDITLVLEYGSCTTPSGGSTGIVDNNNSFLDVYPNPSSDIVNLNSSSAISSYTVYNMLGNRLFSANVNLEKTVIDISSLTKGVYIIEVNQKGKFTNKRIVKK
ncbi:T9SS type A sorting domain-containing protein [Bacteroidota bacterium]|nr:T9SS type A sorting domain-containing protein [Bacteroidota bacterium]